MAILDEFDEKIDKTSKQLEDLLNKSSKITSVNDLLVDGNDHHKESNRLLQSLHDDLRKHSASIKDAIQELSHATSVIHEANPSRIIGVVEDNVRNIQNQQDQIVGAIQELTSKVEEIDSRNQDNMDKTHNAVRKKINLTTTLGILNLFLIGWIIYVTIYLK